MAGLVACAEDSSPTCDTVNEDCMPGTCIAHTDEPPAWMLPGSDCIACHSPIDFGNDDPPEDPESVPRHWLTEHYSVAGTVFSSAFGGDGLQDVIVYVQDAQGTEVELRSNAAGNFYTEAQLEPPLRAAIEFDGQRREMSASVGSGACNSCHSCEGEAGEKLNLDASW